MDEGNDQDSAIGTIQLCRESITHIEAKDICSSIGTHSVQVLSLRECKIKDADFKNVMRQVGLSKAILQLSLNVGLVNTLERVQLVTKAINKNRSLKMLFMHGSNVGSEGTDILLKAIAFHPNIISLDLGQCKLGDDAVSLICDLLPDDGAKPGLKELSLSGNPRITSKGWSKLFISVAACNSLKALYLDYNAVGNYGAGCLAVALAGKSNLEVLDLEGTGITDHGAQTLLFLLKNYPIKLKILNLTGNKIKMKILEAITYCLVNESDEGSDVEDVVPGDGSSEESDDDEIEKNLEIQDLEQTNRKGKRKDSKKTEKNDIKLAADDGDDDEDDDSNDREEVLNMFEELMSEKERNSDQGSGEDPAEKPIVSKTLKSISDDEDESETGTVIVHEDYGQESISVQHSLHQDDDKFATLDSEDEYGSDEGEFLKEVPLHPALSAPFIPVQKVQKDGTFYYNY